MENIVKTYKEQSTELAKALKQKLDACISKQDAICEAWHDTEQVIRDMEDNTDTFVIDVYDKMCENTTLYSNINQRIKWQIEAIDAMTRALEEIESSLEEIDYQDIQIRLYEGRVNQ